MDKLLVRDLQFLAYHGVFDEEQLAGTEFVVDLDIEWDASKAAATDDLNDAIDYGKVYDIVAQEMKINSRLIEHVAGRIQQAIVERFDGITALKTCLRKRRPPVVGYFGSVTIELNWKRE